MPASSFGEAFEEMKKLEILFDDREQARERSAEASRDQAEMDQPRHVPGIGERVIKASGWTGPCPETMAEPEARDPAAVPWGASLQARCGGASSSTSSERR
jgi:hypothetical protein